MLEFCKETPLIRLEGPNLCSRAESRANRYVEYRILLASTRETAGTRVWEETAIVGR